MTARPGRLGITRHARRRWAERAPTTLPIDLAVEGAIDVPASAARRLVDVNRRRKGQHFKAGASGFFVLSGHVVVTCFRMSRDDLASLLVWVCCGVWP